MKQSYRDSLFKESRWSKFKYQRKFNKNSNSFLSLPQANSATPFYNSQTTISTMQRIIKIAIPQDQKDPKGFIKPLTCNYLLVLLRLLEISFSFFLLLHSSLDRLVWAWFSFFPLGWQSSIFSSFCIEKG